MTNRPLDPKPESIPVNIDCKTIIIASIVFAIIFFIIGSIFRHYTSISGVI